MNWQLFFFFFGFKGDLLFQLNFRQTTYDPFTGNLTSSCPPRPKTSVRIVKTGVRSTRLFILFEREEIKKKQELSVKYSINYSSTIELTKFCEKSLTSHVLKLTIY